MMLRLFFAFLVAAVDLWVGDAFSFLVGDFLSFLFLGRLLFVLAFLVADFLCITLFYGFYNLVYRFLSFFVFFVLPVNLFFFVKVSLRVGARFFVLFLLLLSYQTFFGRLHYAAGRAFYLRYVFMLRV